MAFKLYQRTELKNRIRFTCANGALHLFGCNNGLIAQYFSGQVPRGRGNEFGWELQPPVALRALSKPGNAFIIELRPFDAKTVGLYELTDVYGYSYSIPKEWTPLMLRTLPVLERKRTGVDPDDFSMPISKYRELPAVYTFLYAAGTMRRGKLVGTWNPPKPGATNAPVLYPDALKFFLSKMY